MICPFCGKTFDGRASRTACGACALLRGCRKIKCPHCGYDLPAETRLMRWLRNKLGKRHGQS